MSDAHTGLGILPVPTSQTGKVIIHREVGRVLRKVSSQRWGRVSQYCLAVLLKTHLINLQARPRNINRIPSNLTASQKKAQEDL